MATGIPIRLRPIPVWHQRWGTVALKKKHDEDQSAFKKGFLMIAAAEGDLTFPAFDKCCVPGVTLGDIQRNNWPAFTGVDLASSDRKGVAIVTVKVDSQSMRRYPVDVRVGSWKANQIADQLSAVNAAYRPTVIMVESNATQDYLIQYIQAAKYEYWHKVEATETTGGKKNSETYGLPALQVEFSNRAWVIPQDKFDTGSTADDGTIEDNPWKRWAYEFRNHPLAASTDLVMATWFARQGIEQHGYAFDVQPVQHSISR